MPKTHLLNSAVMPQQGFYELSAYDGDTWAKKLIEAHNDENLNITSDIKVHLLLSNK